MASNRVTATVTGTADIKATAQKLAARVEAAARRAVGDEAEAVANDMIRLAPRATGELRQSIRARSFGLRGEARARARHATFVEFGTYKDKAHPFAEPSASISRRRFPKRVTSTVEKALS